MNTYIDKLTNLLLEKNDMLSYLQARTWVELYGEISKRLTQKPVARIKESK